MKDGLSSNIRSLVFFPLAVASACLLISCTSQEKHRSLIEDKTYTIMPGTILHSLADGKEDVFTLNMSTPQLPPISSNLAVTWKQADYYFIAKSFHESVVEETIDGWNLKEMSFNVDCKDVPVGLQEGGFTLFKTEAKGSLETRIVHFIYINPNQNKLDYSVEEYSPKLENWPSLNLTQIKISAEDAVRIAEAARSTNLRKDVDNSNCYITEAIDAGGKHSGWDVVYSSFTSSHNLNSFLEIIVDATTGKYQILP